MSRLVVRPIKVAISLLLLAGLVLGCGQIVCAAEHEIKATLGKPFRIVLSAAVGSSGYSWSPQFNEASLKLENTYYEKPDSKLLGASGKQVFVFIPLKQGSATIAMHLRRTWESSPVESRTYHIAVSPR